MTSRTIAHQAPLSMGFSRKIYWSGLPWSPLLQGIFGIQGLNSHLHVSCIGRWVLYHLYHLGSLQSLLTGPNFIDFYDHFPLILLHLIVSYMKKKKRHKKDEWKAISKLSGKDMLLLFFLINSWWSVQVSCCFMVHS